MSEQGLPTRSIKIASADLMELHKDVWSNQFVPVWLVMDGKSMEAKLRIRGGHTRNYMKKSYEVQFGDNRTLHWNAEFDDPSMIRNALSFRFFNLIGVPAPETRHMQLEWNGEQHGVYLEIEAVDTEFFRKRGIRTRSLIYATNDNANFSLIDPDTKKEKSSLFSGYQMMKGSELTKKRLTRFVDRINRPVGRSLRAYITKRLDINQYLEWLAGAVLTNNYDGFDQNYALYEHLPSGKYRIIPWDYEGTWGRSPYGKLCRSDLVPVKGDNKLTGRLFAYRSCRLYYRRFLRKVLRRQFTVEAIAPIIEELYGPLSKAIRNDFTRKWPYDTFLKEPEVFRNYINERRAIIIGELKKWTN
ncbi:CotH kinase family protein [Paenibacillus sp. sptzw28]|uniref:CotH kinase family protein n=1 Tax=Paenibacillus sp. sptzw28 TaxID=715179 RepID=UPI001C6DEECE|nr:CotH kinase family protein [Paenibacillus sp. sptzw28]QYR22929.1 CotH kinase family protein [Paenibacillus sp. sptzw28]